MNPGLGTTATVDGTDWWLGRVDDYLSQLSAAAADLDQRLSRLRTSTVGVDIPEVEQHLTAIAQRLGELETLILRRQELIEDDAAPEPGSTLVEKLGFLGESSRLSNARQIASTIDDLRVRADALFVCSLHLRELTAEMLRTLLNDQTAQVYTRAHSGTEAPPRSSGGIFSELV